MKRHILAGLMLLALLAINPATSLADDLPTGSDEVISEGNRDATTAAAEYEAAYDICMAQNCLDYGTPIIFILLPAPPIAPTPTSPADPKTPKLDCSQLAQRQAQLGDLINKWEKMIQASGEITWQVSSPVTGQSFPTTSAYNNDVRWELITGATKVQYGSINGPYGSFISTNGTRMINAYENVSKALKEKCFKTSTTR